MIQCIDSEQHPSGIDVKIIAMRHKDCVRWSKTQLYFLTDELTHSLTVHQDLSCWRIRP